MHRDKRKSTETSAKAQRQAQKHRDKRKGTTAQRERERSNARRQKHPGRRARGRGTNRRTQRWVIQKRLRRNSARSEWPCPRASLAQVTDRCEAAPSATAARRGEQTARPRARPRRRHEVSRVGNAGPDQRRAVGTGRHGRWPPRGSRRGVLVYVRRVGPAPRARSPLPRTCLTLARRGGDVAAHGDAGKPAGEDKRLYKILENKFSEDHDDELITASPFGPLSQQASRKTLYYLIATLNASFPDYDFRHGLLIPAPPVPRPARVLCTDAAPDGRAQLASLPSCLDVKRGRSCRPCAPPATARPSSLASSRWPWRSTAFQCPSPSRARSPQTLQSACGSPSTST